MVSIIIVCREIDKLALRCITNCQFLPNNKEIIVVDDMACLGYPGEKRNWALKRAKGDFVAFIDSDAYPSMDWLNNALAYLAPEKIVAVCGPGILPVNSSLSERASDLIYRLLPYSYRVTRKEMRIVPEYPTFNLITKRKYCVDFQPFLTGEDSLFCREISKWGKILYTPDVVVYHNRRPLFQPFLKQVSTYGLHRGHLIKLALLGLITTVICYGYNFIRGFLKRKL